MAAGAVAVVAQPNKDFRLHQQEPDLWSENLAALECYAEGLISNPFQLAEFAELDTEAILPVLQSICPDYSNLKLIGFSLSKKPAREPWVSESDYQEKLKLELYLLRKHMRKQKPGTLPYEEGAMKKQAVFRDIGELVAETTENQLVFRFGLDDPTESESIKKLLANAASQFIRTYVALQTKKCSTVLPKDISGLMQTIPLYILGEQYVVLCA